MKLFKFKIPSVDNVETEGVETWVVSWRCMTGTFDSCPRAEPRYQAFIDYEKAVVFKQAIEQAHKLLGNTTNTHVSIKKQEPGL